MATIHPATSSAPTATQLAILQITDPRHHRPQYAFSFADFLQREHNFTLSPQPKNKPSQATNSHPTFYTNLVCKHWLRGLCKKGPACEFLHEYNLRRMPECNHFVRSGYCPNGDDCLYLHIDPHTKLAPCPHYERGFCPLGPRCAKKHTRKVLCKYYLAGFCPYGRQCVEGVHARCLNDEDMPRPEVRVERTKEEIEEERQRAKERAEEEEEKYFETRGGMRGGRGGRGRGRGRGRAWG